MESTGSIESEDKNNIIRHVFEYESEVSGEILYKTRNDAVIAKNSTGGSGGLKELCRLEQHKGRLGVPSIVER